MSDHTNDGDFPADATPPTDATAPGSGVATATHAPRSAAPKIAIGLAVTVALAAGATIFALRSAATGGALDEGVPADVVAFGRASLRPDADQRSAIDSILARLPEGQADRFRATIGQALEDGFADQNLSYTDDIEPWLGAEIGFVIPTLGAGDLAGSGPDVIALLSVRDEGAARAALQRAASSGDAFEVVDGIAYVSERASTLGPFVDRATSETPLSENLDYQAAVAELGRGVGFLWADGTSLAGLSGVAPGIPTGNFGMVARVTPTALEVEGKAFGAPANPAEDGGTPALVEQSSAGQLGSMSFFGLGTALLSINDALAFLPLSPAEVLGPFNQVGIDPVNDLAPWLMGEFSVVVGGFAGAGVPIVGAIIESTDDDALDRTLEALNENIGALGRMLDIPLEANQSGDTLVIGADGFGAFIDRQPGKLAIASTPDFAKELLRGAPDPLGTDTVYRATMGETGDGTMFQAYVRIDKIRDLALAFLSSEERVQYDATAGPVVDLMEALAIRASTADGGSFLMRLTLAEG